MRARILSFSEIRSTDAPFAGGKGVQLATLSRTAEFQVPPGVVVTTHAFREMVAESPRVARLLDPTQPLDPQNLDQCLALGGQLRQHILHTPLPLPLRADLTRALHAQGLLLRPCAVRSSATSEDLLTASSAGQHDSFLEVLGIEPLLEAIRACWASLYSERAVRYAHRNGLELRTRCMAVVVQAMLHPQVSGVLFTADPLSGNRTITRVEAVFGLGEALVSGQVAPDAFTVRGGQVLTQRVADKTQAIQPDPAGGTRRMDLPLEQPSQCTLTPARLSTLETLGRRIEAQSGHPQDIEWCLDESGFHVVQARAITTLFPIPEASGAPPRVYFSVGHQQMMTDALKPLGYSLFQQTALRPMFEAGGRLFVDVTEILRIPAGRAGLMANLRRFEPLMLDALETLLAGDTRWDAPDPAFQSPPIPPLLGSGRDDAAPLRPDPLLVPALMARTQTSLAAAARTLEHLSGPALFAFIQEDLAELKRLLLDPRSSQIIFGAIDAAHWLNTHLEEWLGEKNVADTLTLSVPHNVTSELGLALLELADALRPFPKVVEFLPTARDAHFLESLEAQEGGREARAAFELWLKRYGMRGVGEIDLTRPRWVEQPTLLVPLLLSHLQRFAPGEAQRRFSQGLQQAQQKADEVLLRLQTLPDGDQKVRETREKLELLRTYIGYREFPKFSMIQRYWLYKQALLREAAQLVRNGVLNQAEDCFYLTLTELREAVSAQQVPEGLIRARAEAHQHNLTLSPPRVLTSDGVALFGSYHHPTAGSHCLAGVPVSTGSVEGRARVILDLHDAVLVPGDILVTRFTDPSWTAVFVSIAGLVTEIGGVMTHGAVVAREYGVPAVVGVQNATRLIRDGQRIRVNGTDGEVTLLD